MKPETTTNEIMEFLQEHMVTKEDLKVELKGFITKKDLKTELEGFITKKDLELEFAQSEHRMKSYIDDKLADYTSDIFKRLDKKYQSEKQFRSKVVELFKKHNIGTSEELAYLEGLAGSE